MGHYREALADLDHALTLDENFVYALVNRAKVYRKIGQFEEALADLDHTITLIEKDRWSTTQQALADPDHAIPHDTDWYWYERALLHLLMEQQVATHADIEMAIKIANISLQHIPEHIADYYRISFNLALYHLARGNAEESEAKYSRLLASCAAIPTIRDVGIDMQEFLAIVPEHELAKHILIRISERIVELSRT